jgi:hypothetical protein
MGTISLQLPDSMERQVRELAEREGISFNQFVAAAVAEKLSAVLTEDYLEARAKRADRKEFEAVLRKVKDQPPMPGDEL